MGTYSTHHCTDTLGLLWQYSSVSHCCSLDSLLCILCRKFDCLVCRCNGHLGMVHRLNLSDPLYSVLLHEFLLGTGNKGCQWLEPRRSEKCTVNDMQNIVPRKRIISPLPTTCLNLYLMAVYVELCRTEEFTRNDVQNTAPRTEEVQYVLCQLPAWTCILRQSKSVSHILT